MFHGFSQAKYLYVAISPSMLLGLIHERTFTGRSKVRFESIPRGSTFLVTLVQEMPRIETSKVLDSAIRLVDDELSVMVHGGNDSCLVTA